MNHTETGEQSEVSKSGLSVGVHSKAAAPYQTTSHSTVAATS